MSGQHNFFYGLLMSESSHTALDSYESTFGRNPRSAKINEGPLLPIFSLTENIAQCLKMIDRVGPQNIINVSSFFKPTFDTSGSSVQSTT